MTLKVEVWCIVSATRIIGPVLFLDTVNSERCFGQILIQIFEKLSDDKKDYRFFHQDSAAGYTANDFLPKSQ
jgi:hypothetical protein